MEPENEILFDIKGLKKHYSVKSAGFQSDLGVVKAVDGIDIQIKKGETLGLVGESGCGKSTLGRAILQLEVPDGGTIAYDDKELTDLYKTSFTQKFIRTLSLFFSKKTVEKMFGDNEEYKKLKYQIDIRKHIQVIFQDPFSSLNPRHTVGRIIGEGLMIHGLATKKDRIKKVRDLMDLVGLRPESYMSYPHEFSGGQRQRISVARALAMNPEFIVCDEPVSALDVSIQAQVINLLIDLQKRFNLTYLFISHDLSVVRYISDRVAVMYLGRIVELADNEELYNNPKHPYTKILLEAVPVPDTSKKRKKSGITGDIPSPLSPPEGCHFHPRCPEVMDICKKKVPQLIETNGHKVRCFLYDK
ncbi:MAG: ATP-binding cassette domain-containing protein [Desulfobacterales bacterium]|nr:ATP-binding cassette domain-containing protein [Desulfobacterales bacterium]MCP4162256.1 ATP-binding cassette domain-containing protein [Deltaproteobacteria bacterium]